MKNFLPKKRSDKRRLPDGEQRYIAYAFCGIVSYVLASYYANGRLYFDIDKYKTILPSALLIGMVVYALYRRLFGEIIYYPLQYEMHYIISRLISLKNRSALYYFRDTLSLPISIFMLDDAYGIARHVVEDAGESHFWSGARIELHILYLLATFSLLFSIAAGLIGQSFEAEIFTAITAGALISAFVGDSMQQRREIYQFKSYNQAISDAVKAALF